VIQVCDVNLVAALQGDESQEAMSCFFRKLEEISFSGQRYPGPLCDDLPEFLGKLVAIAGQPLIKRALRPIGRLLSRLLVLRGLTLVLL
jgi:hypothetical protein